MEEMEYSQQHAPSLEQVLGELASRLQSNQLTAAASVPTPSRPRAILPDPEPFDGKTRTLYPQFRTKLAAKLEVDHATLGGEKGALYIQAQYCSRVSSYRAFLPSVFSAYAQSVKLPPQLPSRIPTVRRLP